MQGTAMRFLTAFFAVNEGQVVLTGSRDRPIKVLVEALEQLGDLKVGYPPIQGRKITASKVNIPANVSSQYISALMLIAPKLENGIKINLVENYLCALH
jgi:3-phosphoshikimate 1-carboxyvinyltransferase